VQLRGSGQLGAVQIVLHPEDEAVQAGLRVQAVLLRLVSAEHVVVGYYNVSLVSRFPQLDTLLAVERLCREEVLPLLPRPGGAAGGGGADGLHLHLLSLAPALALGQASLHPADGRLDHLWAGL